MDPDPAFLPDPPPYTDEYSIALFESRHNQEMKQSDPSNQLVNIEGPSTQEDTAAKQQPYSTYQTTPTAVHQQPQQPPNCGCCGCSIHSPSNPFPQQANPRQQPFPTHQPYPSQYSYARQQGPQYYSGLPPPQQRQQNSVANVYTGPKPLVGDVQPLYYQSYNAHIALACFVTFFFGLLFGLIAFSLAITARDQAKSGQVNQARHHGRASVGVSIAGVVIGGVFIVIGVVYVYNGYTH